MEISMAVGSLATVLPFHAGIISEAFLPRVWLLQFHFSFIRFQNGLI